MFQLGLLESPLYKHYTEFNSWYLYHPQRSLLCFMFISLWPISKDLIKALRLNAERKHIKQAVQQIKQL